MSARRVLLDIHSWIGLTAGILLAVIGLSGALLAFRAEITETLDPTLFERPAPIGSDGQAAARALTPNELAERLARSHPEQRLQSLTLNRDPERPVRVVFAPPPGERRGPRLWIDPWTADDLPAPRAEAFFETVDALHRWLLLPREDGKPITGSLAGLLIVLSLSGLYLRWPRRVGDWRAWLRIDLRLRGRALLWQLHAVVGTVALVCYLVSALTGIYWAFDPVRRWVDTAVGEARPPPAPRADASMARRPDTGGPAGAPPTQADSGRRATQAATALAKVDLASVWTSFQARRGGLWQEVSLRLPSTPGAAVEINVLPSTAAHERARDRLSLDPVSGEWRQERLFVAQTPAARLVNSIYALHLGTYWGLAGRLVMTATSLALVGFAITGWLLYLGRRRRHRESQTEKRRLLGALAPTDGASSAGGNEGVPASPSRPPVLVAYASQTGRAERLAWQTALALREAGLMPEVRSLAGLQPGELNRNHAVLLVASSTGDGEAPDGVRRFARALERLRAPLVPAPAFGLLALGDRHYPRFCEFGHSLARHLSRLGARPLFPPVEVDGLDPTALARWKNELALAFDRAVDLAGTSVGEDWATVTLTGRRHLNPGSPGTPLNRIRLGLPDDAQWQPGTLVEIQPPTRVPSTAATGAAQQDELPRRYSVASCPHEGWIELWVREAQRPDGRPGLVSGWLAHCPPGTSVNIRLLANPSFRLIDDDRPCIFIGNGSGFAGLRGHLSERASRGHGRNWLIFGERRADADAAFLDEVRPWQTASLIEAVDIAWSREEPGRYVQDVLSASAAKLDAWLAQGAVIYVCGSRAGMGEAIDAMLLSHLGAQSYADLIEEGRLRRDVY